jgi:hypothetical protein
MALTMRTWLAVIVRLAVVAFALVLKPHFQTRGLLASEARRRKAFLYLCPNFGHGCDEHRLLPTEPRERPRCPRHGEMTLEYPPGR